MGRPRHQYGCVEKTGKLVAKWKGHWFEYSHDEQGQEHRHHRSQILGVCRVNTPDGRPADLPQSARVLDVLDKHEAELALKELIRKAVAPAVRPVGPATVGWYLDAMWLPIREGVWERATKKTNHWIFDTYLRPRWANVALKDVTVADAASWLAGLAEKYSESHVRKCCTYLRSIVREAFEDDRALTGNPLRRLRAPRTRPVSRPVLSVDDVVKQRAEFREFRDRVIYDAYILTGVRPGELAALRWNDWKGYDLRIDETFTKSEMKPRAKTKDSIACVYVPDSLQEGLLLWKEFCNPVTEDVLIFPSANGTPIYPRNWTRDVLKGVIKRSGVKANYQTFRRTFATLANDSGVSLKAISTQMRHSSVKVTADTYIQSHHGGRNNPMEYFASFVGRPASSGVDGQAVADVQFI